MSIKLDKQLKTGPEGCASQTPRGQVKVGDIGGDSKLMWFEKHRLEGSWEKQVSCGSLTRPPTTKLASGIKKNKNSGQGFLKTNKEIKTHASSEGGDGNEVAKSLQPESPGREVAEKRQERQVHSIECRLTRIAGNASRRRESGSRKESQKKSPLTNTTKQKGLRQTIKTRSGNETCRKRTPNRHNAIGPVRRSGTDYGSKNHKIAGHECATAPLWETKNGRVVGGRKFGGLKKKCSWGKDGLGL